MPKYRFLAVLSLFAPALWANAAEPLHARLAVPSSGAAAHLGEMPDAPAPPTSPSAAKTVRPTGDQRPAKGASLRERFLNEVDPGYLHVGDKWDVTVNKGERVRPLTASDKLRYAYQEEKNPVVLFTASWSAGYEQLRDGDPRFGSDSAGFGERLGAAAFRQGTYRLFGDGVFPALTHEDPRYYRVAEGSLRFRVAHSLEQVIVAHRDDGSRGFNDSTFLGEAVANTLPLTFYPYNSARASVAAKGFAISLLDDGVLKLAREFLPDLLGLGTK